MTDRTYFAEQGPTLEARGDEPARVCWAIKFGDAKGDYTHVITVQLDPEYGQTFASDIAYNLNRARMAGRDEKVQEICRVLGVKPS